MSQFEYVAVVLAVIVGLGIVHLLKGASRFIGASHQWKPYWVHLLWTAVLFYQLVYFWWFSWKWSLLPDWPFPLFMFLLGNGVLLYLLCTVLYPRDTASNDFREVFYQNRVPYFSLLLLLALLEALDSWLDTRFGVADWSTLAIVGPSLFLGVLLFVGILTRRHWYHALLALFILIGLVVQSILFWATLGAGAERAVGG